MKSFFKKWYIYIYIVYCEKETHNGLLFKPYVLKVLNTRAVFH